MFLISTEFIISAVKKKKKRERETLLPFCVDISQIGKDKIKNLLLSYLTPVSTKKMKTNDSSYQTLTVQIIFKIP